MSAKIAERWFETEAVGTDIAEVWEPYVEPFLRCNIWLVRGRDRHLLVDTGLGVSSLRDALADALDKTVVALATHTHYDHVGGMHEFEVRAVHPLEAELLASPPPGHAKLRLSQFPDRLRSWMADVGYAPEEDELLTAYPSASFEPGAFGTKGAEPTWLVEQGDVIDLGDRAFEVLHLPGHTPGSIGLWDPRSGVLFSGDAIYEGPLLDIAPSSDVAAYIDTMNTLRRLPVSVVHGGHGPSFGRSRLVDIIDEYLRSKGAPYETEGRSL
jgi:glyoxylase-like metal-dependent hydrolase (beta-lactamase superfamily II)